MHNTYTRFELPQFAHGVTQKSTTNRPNSEDPPNIRQPTRANALAMHRRDVHDALRAGIYITRQLVAPLSAGLWMQLFRARAAIVVVYCCE